VLRERTEPARSQPQRGGYNSTSVRIVTPSSRDERVEMLPRFREILYAAWSSTPLGPLFYLLSLIPTQFASYPLPAAAAAAALSTGLSTRSLFLPSRRSVLGLSTSRGHAWPSCTRRHFASAQVPAAQFRHRMRSQRVPEMAQLAQEMPASQLEFHQ
jgi:hypothetical protein